MSADIPLDAHRYVLELSNAETDVLLYIIEGKAKKKSELRELLKERYSASTVYRALRKLQEESFITGERKNLHACTERLNEEIKVKLPEIKLKTQQEIKDLQEKLAVATRRLELYNKLLCLYHIIE